jgi:hypothetical protein
MAGLPEITSDTLTERCDNSPYLCAESNKATARWDADLVYRRLSRAVDLLTSQTPSLKHQIAVSFIVSRVMNHASDTGDAAAVTAVYDRNAYLPEKRRALEAWASLLGEIVGERLRASNVVAIRS